MKAPDIVPAWMWKSPEEIIERLIAISARPTHARTTEQQDEPEQQGPRTCSQLLNLFRPSPVIQRKADSSIVARRKAAMQEAANDPIMKAMRKAR